MSVAQRIGGILVPVTTPFDPMTGDVAPVPFRDNLRSWIADGVHGVVLFGTTGEAPLLDEDERLALMEYARDVVPPEAVLIAGAGADSTRAAVRLARSLGAAGAEAVLVHPPVFFAPALDVASIVAHYRAVADGSPVPVVLYHFPKFTHVEFEAGLVAELARHPNIIGLKDSSGDVKRFAAYTEAVPRDFRLLVGSGALLYTALELGAAGGICGLGLLAASDCAAIVRAFGQGRANEAGRIQSRIAPVHKEVVARYGARGVKAALDMIGLHGGDPRPPLRPLDDKARRQVEEALSRAALGGAAARAS
ncbi:MAG TPA: dihydrodipicolinate synthase family protein [Longimicrobiales bacterium]|nr:dihydrodipicolinate synthase family protein [Longimicrobiales bacterium]